jgi:hypothetical protein
MLLGNVLVTLYAGFVPSMGSNEATGRVTAEVADTGRVKVIMNPLLGRVAEVRSR